MRITSPAFENNQPLPARYTCDGEGINPPLLFAEAPENTKSFVLIVDDPDAPAGTWVHWVIFNIPKETREIKENSRIGSEGVNSSGSLGYEAPCPPSGTHRYFFKLYALDTMLSLLEKADKKTVDEAMQGHVIANTELIGLYSK